MRGEDDKEYAVPEEEHRSSRETSRVASIRTGSSHTIHNNNSDDDINHGPVIEQQPEAHGETVGAITKEEVQDLEAQEVDPEAADVLPPQVVVPRSKRRGLFGKFTILPEVEDPKHYDRKLKWIITAIISFAGVAAPIGTTILLPSLGEIALSLHTSENTTNLSIGFYLLSLAICPLFWSSFCETSGRRTIYMISFTLNLVFSILSAVSTNIGMFIVMRVLAGGASASVQTVGAGTLADIWHVKERGRAMGYFYLGPLMGPLLAPIVGGALQLRWGWRSNLWFLTIYAFLTFNLLFWLLPETLKRRKSLITNDEMIEAQAERTKEGLRPALSRVSTRQSLQRKTKTIGSVLKRVFIDPFNVFWYLRFPAVANSVYYASVTFGSLYVLQVSIQATFEASPYNFTSIEVGLAYLPNSLGYIVASVLGGRWTDRIMAREARKANRRDERGKLIYRPEDRMRENAWLAAVLYPTALIWYGWTSHYHVHWAVPMVANFFFGLGSMLIFGMVTTMLTEFMPKRASSGIALNNFVRNCLSCIGANVSVPLLNAIGAGWLFTGLGAIALASSASIWAMKRYGPVWRARMDALMPE